MLNDHNSFDVNLDNILKANQYRFAAKDFADTKLDDDQIAFVKNVFTLAPTSFGLQPIHLTIIENQDIIDTIADTYCYGQSSIKSCSHLLVLSSDVEFDEADCKLSIQLYGKLNNKTLEESNKYLNSVLKYFYRLSPDQFLEWSKNQAYIVAGYMLANFAMAKIESCPMEGFVKDEIDRIIGLSSIRQKSQLLIPIGLRHTDTKQPIKVRKNELISTTTIVRRSTII